MVEKVLTTSEAWLGLGIPGAALLIVMVVILLMFKQYSKSVDKLCDKIDGLISSNSDVSTKLNEVLLSNDKDQKELIRLLTEANNIQRDTHKRVVRIDTRLYQSITGRRDEEVT